MLGTPGGDMGEMVAAIIAWHKMEGQKFNKTAIAELFNKFMDNVVTPNRPFYFHTDDNRLRRMFVRLNQQSIEPMPSKLPDVGPSNAADATKWLDELVFSESQGCGHIRLQLSPEFSKYYSVKLSGPNVTNCDGVAAPDCINSEDIAAEVIRLFFNCWWFTPAGSPQRSKVRLVVDVGPLVGKAVTIVGQTDNNGSCALRHPLIFPNQGGSTLFVYHAKAVGELRDFAVRRGDLAPQGGKRGRLIKLWNEVAGMQLGSTLTYLNPANQIGLFAMTLETSRSAGRKLKM